MVEDLYLNRILTSEMPREFDTVVRPLVRIKVLITVYPPVDEWRVRLGDDDSILIVSSLEV